VRSVLSKKDVNVLQINEFRVYQLEKTLPTRIQEKVSEEHAVGRTDGVKSLKISTSLSSFGVFRLELHS